MPEKKGKKGNYGHTTLWDDNTWSEFGKLKSIHQLCKTSVGHSMYYPNLTRKT